MTVTTTAADLVHTLADRAGLPGHGGLRIEVNPTTNSLSMGLTEVADPSDVVIAHDDALVYLSAEAEERLRGQTLCAEVTDARSVFFLQAA